MKSIPHEKTNLDPNLEEELTASLCTEVGKRKCIHYHRDLIRPSSIEKAFEIKEKHLSNSPEILKNDFYASLKASFTVEEVSKQLFVAGLSQLEVFQVDELYFEIIGCI